MQETVRQIHDHFDLQLARWLEHRSLTERLRCGPGCCACCDVPVLTSLAEVMPIHQTTDRALRLQIKARHEAILSLWVRCRGEVNLWARTYRYRIGPCLFLDREGSCRIYPLRPLPCRQTLSIHPPLLCRRDLEQRLSKRQRLHWSCKLSDPLHRGLPYLHLPLRYGHLLEGHLHREMVRNWGVGIWGNLWSLLDLCRALDSETGSAWGEALRERVARGLPPTLLSQRV